MKSEREMSSLAELNEGTLQGLTVPLIGLLRLCRSLKNKITQYEIQADDGTRFFEFEEELSGVALTAATRSGPLTGAWACVSTGLPQGDLKSTLYVQQDQREVKGVVSWPEGAAAFISSTSKLDALEFRLDPVYGSVPTKSRIPGRSTRRRMVNRWRAER
jgi:hypothetical protein